MTGIAEKFEEEEEAPAYMRAYTCNLWKSLMIGPKIKFENGFYQTDDPSLQSMIERNDAFGVSIHYQDTLEVMEARGRELSEQRANEKARRRQELLDELAAEERADKERLQRLAAEQAKRDEKRRDENALKAAAEKAQRDADKVNKDAADRAAAQAAAELPKEPVVATPDMSGPAGLSGSSEGAFGGITGGDKAKNKK